jgi:hypothetical protein
VPSMAKKKVVVAVASMTSTEAFPMAELALQLEVPTVAAANIHGRKVGEEYWNFGLDGWLEAMVASIQLEAAMVNSRMSPDLPRGMG